MKKLLILLVVCVLSINYANAQCKKIDMEKLIQLRIVEDKEFKEAIEALGFKEKKSSFGAKISKRECTLNSIIIEESITKFLSKLTYFINDKSTFDLLLKEISSDKNYTNIEDEDKNYTKYKSKKDYVTFIERGNEFQISISNPL